MEWLTFRDPVSAWTHLIWMVLAIPGTIYLWRASRGDRPKQISLLVFGLGTIICFGSSGVYHALRLPYNQLEPFLRMDHIGIYVLIAASCTGIAFSLLRGRWRNGLLTFVWLAAAIGIVGRLFFSDRQYTLNPTIYLIMGWALASSWPQLVRAVGAWPVGWVWLGGGLYTLGAASYMAQWPELWPGVFGSHEMLHVFDMAGNFVHFWFIVKYVIPYPRLAAEATSAPLNGFDPAASPVIGN
jgi:hemolysin III